VARKELVAALLHTSPTNTDELAERLKKYRRARVRDTYVGPTPSGNVVSFPEHAPGPRTRAK
jgi:hypothetical protein